jgi:hypothetical protein
MFSFLLEEHLNILEDYMRIFLGLAKGKLYWGGVSATASCGTSILYD